MAAVLGFPCGFPTRSLFVSAQLSFGDVGTGTWYTVKCCDELVPVFDCLLGSLNEKRYETEYRGKKVKREKCLIATCLLSIDKNV